MIQSAKDVLELYQRNSVLLEEISTIVYENIIHLNDIDASIGDKATRTFEQYTQTIDEAYALFEILREQRITANNFLKLLEKKEESQSIVEKEK